MFPALVSLLVAFFFIVLGLMGMILPWSVTARTAVIEFLLLNTITLSIFGFFFFVVGVATIFYIFETSKRRYIRITKEGYKTEISEAVVNDYLSSYFRELFPRTDIPFKTELKKKRAEITIDLPFVTKDEQKDLLEKIEKELSNLFRDILGYRKELRLIISFEAEKP